MRFLFLVLLMMPVAAQAADQAVITTNDVLRGHFVEERQLQGFKAPMRSEGRFTVAPGRGLIWDVQKPFATSTVITPSGLVQIIQGRPVTQLSAQKIPFLLHLYDMLGGALAGNWRPLDIDFTVIRTQNADGWQAVLTPRQSDNLAMPYNFITVSGHHFVEQVVMAKEDGDSDKMIFSDQILSQAPLSAIEKSTFDIVRP